ncbi:MAG: hypothetical protein AMK69_09495 [Nitrospira bacterium SG8_3]|nr:MAG: hypothetical protein AMK69_09495 [Nitrospira bacterium SG8_3]
MVVFGVKHPKNRWELETRLGEDYFPLEGLCHNVIARDSRGGGRTEAISMMWKIKRLPRSLRSLAMTKRGYSTASDRGKQKLGVRISFHFPLP